jgi:hypothetical protein
MLGFDFRLQIFHLGRHRKKITAVVIFEKLESLKKINKKFKIQGSHFQIIYFLNSNF